MNHIYRSLWNNSLGCFVAVPEFAAACGGAVSSDVASAPIFRLAKISSLSLALALAFTSADQAMAQSLPTGANITAGSAQISQSGNQLTINQATNKLATNWQSFNIGAGNSVQFGACQKFCVQGITCHPGA